MRSGLITAIDPWRLELLVVRDGSHGSGERRTLSRDVERGLLIRLRQGVYVERSAFEALSPEEQHIVRMRALAAVSDGPIVFSHFSAAVAHRLAVLRGRLDVVHCTDPVRSARNRSGVVAHRYSVEPAEVVRLHDVLITSIGRTVVDVAGAAPFEEGVMVADAALRIGVPRAVLEAAVEAAGPRRAASRIADVVGFAHPGADSAGESRGRVTMLRIGVEVPVLQQRFVLDDGSAVFADFGFPVARAAAEADGDAKYLDPAMAPDGAGAVLLAEKRREDLLRALLSGLARFGWVQAGSTGLLRPILARAGVHPVHPRPALSDYAVVARSAQPRRFIPRRPESPA